MFSVYGLGALQFITSFSFHNVNRKWQIKGLNIDYILMVDSTEAYYIIITKLITLHYAHYKLLHSLVSISL